jgi:hypothetical protein
MGEMRNAYIILVRNLGVDRGIMLNVFWKNKAFGCRPFTL